MTSLEISKIVLASGFFWLVHHYVLNRYTDLQARRISLLLVVIGTAFIPLLPSVQLGNSVNAFKVLPEITVGSNTIARVSDTNIWLKIYLAGVAIMSARLLIRLLRLRKTFKSSEKINDGIRQFSEPGAPAAFLNTVFLPSILPSHLRDAVLSHERAHAALKHSADILVLEVVQVLYWFNPFYHLLQRDLRLLHELQADQYAKEAVNNYDEQLLEFVRWKNNHGLVSGGSHHLNNLKTRFHFLSNQPKHFKTILMRTLLILCLPVLFVIACQQETLPIKLQEADTSPAYKGGMPELMRFMQTEVVYPESMKESGETGRVMVQFIVNKDGSVSDAKVLKSSNDGFNEAALEAIKDMPDWEPGKKDGETVAVEFVMPIVFKLN